MDATRRSFVRLLGAGGAAAALAPPAWISARGREALLGTPDWRREVASAGSGVLRLNSNENPNGPGPAVLEAVRAAFGQAPLYPSAAVSILQAALARHHGVARESILVGCGSTEVLRMAAYGFTGPGRPLVGGAPTFEDPAHQARLAGAEVVDVPVDAALRLDLDGLARRAPGAGMVFLCNPNNPTGTVHGAGDVRTFVERVDRTSDALILIDEAYHEYVEDPAYASAVPLALDNPRVVVSRTFSKVHGLAGLRVGYAIGRPDTLARLRRYRLPNAVNALGAAAATAAIEGAPAHVERERARNREAREYTRRGFDALGYPSPPSHTNFVMVDLRRDVRPFIEGCRREGVLVGRPFPPLMTHARVSVGTLAEMQTALGVFRRLLATPAASQG